MATCCGHRFSSSFPCQSSILLLLFILPTISLARSSHGLIRSPWGVRGGSIQRPLSQQSQQQLTGGDCAKGKGVLSIGVVRWNDEHNVELNSQISDLPSWLTESTGSLIKCGLLSPNEASTTVLHFDKIPTNTPAMVEALAITCDIIILVVNQGQEKAPPTNSISTQIVRSLLQGLQRRRQGQGVKRSTLVVVVPQDDKDESKSQAWKDHISLHDLAAVTPDLVERLELVTPKELGQLWNELIDCKNGKTESSDGDDDELDAELFPALLQEVYRSLSGDADATLVLERVPNLDAATVASEQATTDGAGKPKSTTNTAILVQQVIWEAQQRLESIETRQEQIWLDDKASPMLEFGSMSEQILIDAQAQLQAIDSYTNEERNQVLMQLAMELRRLYLVQLQALREHFGRRYDAILESTRDERLWTGAAADATERFRIAAQHAIPTLCRQGGPLRDADFNYLPSLHGMISDMTQATALRQDLETSLTEDLDDDIDDDGSTSKRRSKWNHKLAARALVWGVNYLQGWLAWKAIQKAADERDRNIPKFPLF